MHAAQWPGAFSSSGGTISAHAASFAGMLAARMEDAAARRIRRRRHVAGEHDALALDASGSATGTAESSACVYGMIGSRYRSRRGRELDDLAEIHHRHAVGDVLDDREVVRDEQVGEPAIALQILQQVDDLRLHRDVERATPARRRR